MRDSRFILLFLILFVVVTALWLRDPNPPRRQLRPRAYVPPVLEGPIDLPLVCSDAQIAALGQCPPPARRK